MSESPAGHCVGCGDNLTVTNRALNVRGYCRRCVEAFDSESPEVFLPRNHAIDAIATARLQDDLPRFFVVALGSIVFCFVGVVIGVFMSRNSAYDSGDVLRVSWLLGLIGLFVGRLLFLRKGNALTFARWAVFWHAFVIVYFVTYIVLSFVTYYNVLPHMLSQSAWTRDFTVGSRQIVTKLRPFPAIVFVSMSFVPACVFSFLISAWNLKREDRELRRQLSDRCRLPAEILDLAHEGNWDSMQNAVDKLAQRTAGLATPQRLLARVHLECALQQGEKEATEERIRELRNAVAADDTYAHAQFRLGCELTEASRFTEALRALRSAAAAKDSKPLSSAARKAVKTLRRRHGVAVRCPGCGRKLRGLSDILGKPETCPNCGREFVVTEDQLHSA